MSNLKMMSENTRKLTTYMMFSKKENNVDLCVGPTFEQGFEKIRQQYFTDKEYHIMEETAFASFYPQRYKGHIRAFWIDKLWCYFTIHTMWCGQVNLSWRDFCAVGSWFSLFEMQDKDGTKYWQLNFSINHNPFYAARLKQDLDDMHIYDIIIGEEYFEHVKHGMSVGSRALQRSLALEVIENACLT